MGKIIYAEMLSVSYFSQCKLAAVVFVHIVCNSVESARKDFVTLVSDLVYKPSVLHYKVLEI